MKTIEEMIYFVAMVLMIGGWIIISYTKRMTVDPNPKIRLLGYIIAIATVVAAVAVIVCLMIYFGPAILS